MAITNAQIRDLLGRPPGLPEGTITEYISMRTNEADAIARTNKYNVSDDHKVSTAEKEDFIKAAVCVDVLTVLIDTLPYSTMSMEERQNNDTRFRYQLDTFKERAAVMREIIAEPPAAAFSTHSSDTRMPT